MAGMAGFPIAPEPYLMPVYQANKGGNFDE